MIVLPAPAPVIVMLAPAEVPTWSSPSVRLYVPAGTLIVNGPPDPPPVQLDPGTSVLVFAVEIASRSEHMPDPPVSSKVVVTLMTAAADAVPAARTGTAPAMRSTAVAPGNTRRHHPSAALSTPRARRLMPAPLSRHPCGTLQRGDLSQAIEVVNGSVRISRSRRARVAFCTSTARCHVLLASRRAT